MSKTKNISGYQSDIAPSGVYPYRPPWEKPLSIPHPVPKPEKKKKGRPPKEES